MGMLTWMEYPYLALQLDGRSAADAGQGVHGSFFYYDRNHPSILLRSLTCETGPSADLGVIRAVLRPLSRHGAAGDCRGRQQLDCLESHPRFLRRPSLWQQPHLGRHAQRVSTSTCRNMASSRSYWANRWRPIRGSIRAGAVEGCRGASGRSGSRGASMIRRQWLDRLRNLSSATADWTI